MNCTKYRRGIGRKEEVVTGGFNVVPVWASKGCCCVLSWVARCLWKYKVRDVGWMMLEEWLYWSIRLGGMMRLGLWAVDGITGWQTHPDRYIPPRPQTFPRAALEFSWHLTGPRAVSGVGWRDERGPLEKLQTNGPSTEAVDAGIWTFGRGATCGPVELAIPELVSYEWAKGCGPQCACSQSPSTHTTGIAGKHGIISMGPPDWHMGPNRRACVLFPGKDPIIMNAFAAGTRDGKHTYPR